MRLLLAAASVIALGACTTAPVDPIVAAPAPTFPSGDPGAGEAEFRALYKELVETNTTYSVGSCTLASERMKARLLAAGRPIESRLTATHRLSVDAPEKVLPVLLGGLPEAMQAALPLG